jgi:hypothetical protein
MDNLSFDRIIEVVHTNKMNTVAIWEKYKIFPKCKAMMNIPLYRMISMPIVRPALKIDVHKMEQAFHSGYHEGDKVFYVLPLNWKGEEYFIDDHETDGNYN